MERQVNERKSQWCSGWEPNALPPLGKPVQALQNRGLITASRKGGQWSVALTSVGHWSSEWADTPTAPSKASFGDGWHLVPWPGDR